MELGKVTEREIGGWSNAVTGRTTGRTEPVTDWCEDSDPLKMPTCEHTTTGKKTSDDISCENMTKNNYTYIQTHISSNNFMEDIFKWNIFNSRCWEGVGRGRISHIKG